GLKRGYTITVTADELAAKVDEKLVEAQPEIEMKGFRKGKVPMALLKKQFGQRLLGEAMQDAVDGAMETHFKDSGDRPAMQPEVKMTNDDWKEGDDVVVSLSYEALPTVELPALDGVTLEKLVVKAEDSAVQEALENLAKSAQNFEDKDGAAADGDQVTMDFVGKIDGDAFEGGSAEDFPLVLGSGQFIPGFEEQLVGVKTGDTKEATVSFPADYGAEHLAGKEAVFTCTIKAVKSPAEAVIDDALAKQYGADDLDALKAQITERLEAEYSQASRAVLKRNLLDTLDEAVTFDLPPSLVETESKQIAHQLWHDANKEETDANDHSHDAIEPTEESDKLAVRRVKLGLLLAEVGQQAEIEVTDQEMTQAVIAQARQYPGQEREFFEFIQKNQQMQQQLRAPIFEDKVVDHILEKVTVSEKEVSKEDLQKAVETLEDDAA
ncbi:MAG: trigger factor, partial [Alphaproteobacteria bacterium]|nr:trigger factor [Alphaproteobacteria bacterium]